MPATKDLAAVKKAIVKINADFLRRVKKLETDYQASVKAILQAANLEKIAAIQKSLAEHPDSNPPVA